MRTKQLTKGIVLYFDQPLLLDERAKLKLLEKWDTANEEEEVTELLAKAERIAAPKAYVVPVTIDEMGADYVRLGGVRFESILLAERLRPIYDAKSQVYFYAQTCGRELHDWAQACDDVVMRMVADDICLAYLEMVGKALRTYMEENDFSGKHFSSMNPGSLPSWDIYGQVPTFEVLGEGAEACGVSLNESMLMVPFKSGSGLFFETEQTFESCMFCDKKDCPHRRAACVER